MRTSPTTHAPTDLLASLPQAPQQLGTLPGRIVVGVTADSRLVRDVLRAVGAAYYGSTGARYLRAAYRSTLGEELTLGVASVQMFSRADVATLMRTVRECNEEASAALAREVGPLLGRVRRPLAYVPQLAVLEEGRSRAGVEALGWACRALAEHLDASAVLVRTRQRKGTDDSRDLAKAGFRRVLTVDGMPLAGDPDRGADICIQEPAGCTCDVAFWLAPAPTES